MDNNTKFTMYVQALEQYVSKFGHSRIPTSHIEDLENQKINLGAWAGYVRQRYRKNQLSQNRISVLEATAGWQWGPFQPGPATDSVRNEVIRELRIQGKSLREIADEFDLSRQRVHQIVKKLQIQ
jgi:DNA-binding NarL/FixJ family response regulator